MKAMILAAGRGARLRPLTDTTPKPLLAAGGRPLIHYVIAGLCAAGITELVVNVSHLGRQIEAALGDGRQLGVTIRYSREIVALETAGGIAQALPLLGNAPFVVVNADIYTDYEYRRLAAIGAGLSPDGVLAHLVLVDNPPHNARGDFGLDHDRVSARDNHALTFSGIGVYHPALFSALRPGDTARLASVLERPIAAGRVSGEHFCGQWMDIGAPERLAELDQWLRRPQRRV